MKRIIGFMLVLSLFGFVAAANAATGTELTEEQMAQQFGGTGYDNEPCVDWGGFTNCTTTNHQYYPGGTHMRVKCVCWSSNPPGYLYEVFPTVDSGWYIDSLPLSGENEQNILYAMGYIDW